MKAASIMFIAGAMLYPAPAFADYCADKPTQVIVQSDNNIWFTTQNLCKDWCALPSEWPVEQRNRAFSLLMSAISQSKNVTFFFTGPCVTQATYAKPQLFSYSGSN